MTRLLRYQPRRENLTELLFDGADPYFEFETSIQRLHHRTTDPMTRAICRVHLGLPLRQFEFNMLNTNGIPYTRQMAAADLDDLLGGDQ